MMKYIPLPILLFFGTFCLLNSPASAAFGLTVQQEQTTAEENSDDDKDSTKQESAVFEGQSDLDEAFELKIEVRSLRDMDRIADLCESAIEKGLDEESETQAKALWSTVLFEYGKLLEQQILNSGNRSGRWRLMRSQALSRLNQAVEVDPDKVDALILIAKLNSLSNGDKEAGRQAIEKAIEKISGDNQKLSQALYFRSQLTDDEQARIADLAQAVKIDPRNSEALLQRALYYLEKEEKENALADFKQLLALEQDSTERHTDIAQRLQALGMFDESVAIIDLAIEIDKENDSLHLLRGQAHFADRKYKEAVADFSNALEINRQNIDALNLRARIHIIEERYDAALSDVNESIQLKQNPQSLDGLFLRSAIHRAQDNLSAAIKDIELLLEERPNNLDMKLDLAVLLNADDQAQRSIEIFDEIIARTQESIHSQIYRNRGDAFLTLGKHADAVKDYSTALELLEQYKGSEFDAMDDEREQEVKIGVLNNLAWVLATSPKDEVRDGQRAIELATEACELTDYKQAYILSTLASGYAEVGDFETAKKWAAKGVELAESDEQRQGIQDELDFYISEKPWREDESQDKEKSDEAETDETESDDQSEGEPEKSETESQQSDGDSTGKG